MRDPSRFLQSFWAMERALVASGLPAIPGTWWRNTIERFYRSGKRRLVVRKGRRVFASTAIAPRLAVAEMLFGEHEHIPGTPALSYVFLSVLRDESSKRIDGVTAILDALGVGYDRAGTKIRLRDYPAEFVVITANHRASVGGTVAFAWCDEVSRWNDDKTSKNPAEGVITALAPALLTLPDARLFIVSSPLSTQDFHAKCFDTGETEQQCVAFGATWDIRPDITEEDTRRIEPNIRAWTREYAAVPVDGVEEDWFGVAVEAAFELGPLFDVPANEGGRERQPVLDIRFGMRPIFTIDPAFAKHYFGYAVTTSEPANDNGRRLTIVHDSGAWEPNGEPRESLIRLRDMVIDPYLRKAGLEGQARHVHTDQAEFYSLRDVARSVGITLLLVPWTGGSGETSKLAKFRTVRNAMLGDDVRIQSHWSHPEKRNRLVSQFRSVAGVISPAGNERIILKEDGRGHCDELSAVVQGVAIALEQPAVSARPVEVVQKADNPVAWREAEIRKVNEKRAREWKRSPAAQIRRAMGR